MEQFYTAIAPSLLEISGVVVAGAIGWAATYAKRKWGLEIEAKHRDALHSAIMTGVQSALTKGLTGLSAQSYAIEYAKRSVDDAIKALKPGPAILSDLARAKLEQATRK